MSSENRRASLRSRMNAIVAGKESGGRGRGKASTSSRSSSSSKASSPKTRKRGGRRGRSDAESQPRINDSLKAARRGGRRNSAIKTNKLKKQETDILHAGNSDEDEERDSSGSLKVNLGTGQCVESGSSNNIKGNISTKVIKAEGQNESKASTEEELSKEDELMLLKDFDLNVTYGACRGIPRIERYERALKYSLQPPPLPVVAYILRKHPEDFEYSSCIWDQNDLLRVRK